MRHLSPTQAVVGVRDGTNGSVTATAPSRRGEASDGPVTSVAIQDRSRLFRRGLGMLLDSHADLRVDRETASLASLRASRERYDGVIFELPTRADDDPGLSQWIRATDPAVVIIGTFSESGRPPPQLDCVQMVARNSPSSVFASMLKRGDGHGAGPLFWTGPRTEHAWDDLTTRELQVLALICGGLTSNKIAGRLGISVKTVESKRQAIFTKLGVQNQAAAVAVGMRRGLLGVGVPSAAGPGRS